MLAKKITSADHNGANKGGGDFWNERNDAYSIELIYQKFRLPDDKSARPRQVQADDELVIPLHKLAFLQYSSDASGARKLHLYYGDKAILFRDPELFEFGENLAQQFRFTAKTVTEWNLCCDWECAQTLLEQLIVQGILQYAADNEVIVTDFDDDDLTSAPVKHGDDSIFRSFTGKSLEQGHSESVVPVFRIAYIAADIVDRQVDETDIFPASFRRQQFTRSRTRSYPGDHYSNERLVNASALRSTLIYWPQIIAALHGIREAYLRRFPSARHGLTAGDVALFSSVVAAVPAYYLMRTQQPIQNRQLHPALSAMLRIADRLRGSVQQMLLKPAGETAFSYRSAMTMNELCGHVELNYAFFSEYGVCSEASTMMAEFLNAIVNGGTVVNGVPIKDISVVTLDKPVEVALAQVNPALDYGFYGMQTHAAIFLIWPTMERTYSELWTIINGWKGEYSDTLSMFRKRLKVQMNILKLQTHQTTEHYQFKREQVYADIYQHCADGLGLKTLEIPLSELIAPAMEIQHQPAQKKLRAILYRQCNRTVDVNCPDVENLLNCFMNYFLQVQAILRLASEPQQSINQLLGRAAPAYPLDVADISFYDLLQGDATSRLAYLTKEIEDVFNLRIVITKERIEITEVNAFPGPDSSKANN